ncbi:Na(+)/H(+) antiporter NhaA [invertebrate metagenome]|uniref:Na(+)/H(+) antiporter NhaA n=1 Tax=invertebrate metagenome TaxID=1711999 RepID=A0A2H9T8Z5_9ZZZZ
MLIRRFIRFIQQDYAVGVLLMAAAIAAKLAANSSLAPYYNQLLEVPVHIGIGAMELNKPLLLWINDGLMAVFFLLIGLEVKYEVLKGELQTPAQAMLPGIAAIGGMVVPAAIYLAFNHQDPIAAQGWAIPAATDIAFAVGVLALVGRRAPPSLKIFLLALAIIDDLGAIIIIALFYSDNIATLPLLASAVLFGILIIFNRMDITQLSPYLLVGTLLWICILKSGIHATLAGVMIALTIPLNLHDSQGRSPLKALQHHLHSKVNYFILPVFAFANAGVEINTAMLNNLLNPVPMGIIAGLFIGKQLGIFGFTLIAVKLGMARLPSGANWFQMYGIAVLCGIGFTMSLFISSLAFDDVTTGYIVADRLGILTGSVISGIFGFILLYFAGRSRQWD